MIIIAHNHVIFNQQYSVNEMRLSIDKMGLLSSRAIYIPQTYNGLYYISEIMYNPNSFEDFTNKNNNMMKPQFLVIDLDCDMIKIGGLSNGDESLIALTHIHSAKYIKLLLVDEAYNLREEYQTYLLTNAKTLRELVMGIVADYKYGDLSIINLDDIKNINVVETPLNKNPDLVPIYNAVEYVGGQGIIELKPTK